MLAATTATTMLIFRNMIFSLVDATASFLMSPSRLLCRDRAALDRAHGSPSRRGREPDEPW
jgi:hypothetical protein